VKEKQMRIKPRVATRLAGKNKKKDLITRKKFCRFCVDKTKTIDYKDTRRLESFLTERGKIVTSRFSGNCAKHQRRLVEAIKMARFIALVPYAR
jgi:small subunit ribosomal protein S18